MGTVLLICFLDRALWNESKIRPHESHDLIDTVSSLFVNRFNPVMDVFINALRVLFNS